MIHELPALLFPFLPDNRRNVVPFIAVRFYFFGDRCLPYFFKRFSLGVEIPEFWMLLLAALNSDFHNFKHVVQLPEERCYVAPANDNVNLTLVLDGLLVEPQIVDVSLHSAR